MFVYNFLQYSNEAEGIKTLDLSDIITKKLLLNGSFPAFTTDLNLYLQRANIDILRIKPSLLIEIIGIDPDPSTTEISSEPKAIDSQNHVITPFLMGSVSTLVIKDDEDDFVNLMHPCFLGRSFFFFLKHNPGLKEIVCQNGYCLSNSLIIYPDKDLNSSSPFLCLYHPGRLSRDSDHTRDLFFPHGIHIGLLEYYYGMNKREIADYYEWVGLETDPLVEDLTSTPTPEKQTLTGLKASDPFMHRGISIPKIELPHVRPTPQPQKTRWEACQVLMNEVLQASFFMNMASRLFDQARNPTNLCVISMILAGLIAASLPINLSIALSIGLVSGIGFYALGRHSILPTRENAMKSYDSFLGSYRIG